MVMVSPSLDHQDVVSFAIVSSEAWRATLKHDSILPITIHLSMPLVGPMADMHIY